MRGADNAGNALIISTLRIRLNPNAMTTIEQLQQTIEQRINQIQLPAEPALLYQPIDYIMEDGGKRMRPLLTLLAADMFGGSLERAMGSAMTIEVFHNFTLLHDDIMDRSPMRRGRATVHSRWGENVAILSGDAMSILSYKILCDNTPGDILAELMSIFNRAALEVCQGQQMDMDFETQSDVSIWDYMQMIRLKTAVLMAAALKMGAVSAGANSDRAEALYEFGVNLGLAFQIQDDYLDTFGDSATFGKKIGGDIAVGKKTFLYLTALERANAVQREGLLLMDDDFETRFERVRNIYRELEVDKVAVSVIEQYYAQALDVLRDLAGMGVPVERQGVLMDYAASLLHRER